MIPFVPLLCGGGAAGCKTLTPFLFLPDLRLLLPSLLSSPPLGLLGALCGACGLTTLDTPPFRVTGTLEPLAGTLEPLVGTFELLVGTFEPVGAIELLAGTLGLPLGGLELPVGGALQLMLLGAGTTAVVVGDTRKFRESVWGDAGLGTWGAGLRGRSCSFWGLITGEVLEPGVTGDCTTSAVLLLTSSCVLQLMIIIYYVHRNACR